ncbi:MAG TPA: hypothetical protein VKI61_20085, partial [Chitinophagaceae bacterium]|nr:hypothetical protein [Chitinophagaceae bacterium]
MARAYQYLGNLIPQNDTTKPGYYYKSLELYRQLKLKEKQIELLGNLLICHVDIGFNLAENEAREILSLQQSTGFKHTLYVQNIFAYILNNQTKYLIALEYANVAIENMNWSGIDAVAGTFFSRIGVAYIS